MSNTCRTCATETGTTRYCAPGRCYCAHDTCPAEWHPLPAIADTAPNTTNRHAAAWSERGDDSWIDKL